MLIILDMLLVALDAFIWLFLSYLLRSEPARLSRKGIYILCALILFAVVCTYPIWLNLNGSVTSSASKFSGITWLTLSPLLFIVYPGCPYKNLFLLLSSAFIAVTGSGFGNLAELMYPVGRHINLLIRLLSGGIMLTLTAAITKKQFPGLYNLTDINTWRQLSVITAILFLIGIIASGKVVTEETLSMPEFLPLRLCCAVAVLSIFTILGLIQQQSEEFSKINAQIDAAEKLSAIKDKEYTRIVYSVEETNHMRHDLRQMFAAMQWLNHPENLQDLESYCREILSAMDETKKEVGHENF